MKRGFCRRGSGGRKSRAECRCAGGTICRPDRRNSRRRDGWTGCRSRRGFWCGFESRFIGFFHNVPGICNWSWPRSWHLFLFFLFLLVLFPVVVLFPIVLVVVSASLGRLRRWFRRRRWRWRRGWSRSGRWCLFVHEVPPRTPKATRR